MFFEQNKINSFLSKLNENNFIYSYSTIYNNKNTLIKGFDLSCGKGITVNYINDTYKLVSDSYKKNNNEECDLVCVLNQEFSSIKKNNLYKHILGILVVEKGECKDLQNVYSIRLICSSLGKGKLLIALFIYILILNNHELGILELAGGYLNVSGLCLYTKYGFKENFDLYGVRCFDDYNNLPMNVNIKDYGLTKEDQIMKLFQIINGENEGFAKPSICYIRDNKIQLFLGALTNLNLFIQLNQINYIVDQYYFYDMFINFQELQQSFSNEQLIKILNENQYTDEDIQKFNNAVTIINNSPPSIIIPSKVPAMRTRRTSSMAFQSTIPKAPPARRTRKRFGGRGKRIYIYKK